ncbi:MAG: helix-turn-helix domain-containing protein [Rhizobiaceae bacterium]|nr:helix-turn-helix domain-containing protein [Rhizobiaceae bacterium]
MVSRPVAVDGEAKSNRDRGTQCLDRAISILVELAEQSPVGQRLADIAESTHISRPTAHRILKKLSGSGLVVQERGSHRYKIGPLAHTIDALDSRNGSLLEWAQPRLERIAADTGMTALLVTRHGRFATCSGRVDGRAGDHPSFGKVGTVGLLGPSAAGIAILSQLSDAQIEDILYLNEWMIVHLGRATMEIVWRLIRSTRRDGFCTTHGTFIEGVSSIAAPVISGSGRCDVALAVVTADEAALTKSSRNISRLLLGEAEMLGVETAHAWAGRGRLRPASAPLKVA